MCVFRHGTVGPPPGRPRAWVSWSSGKDSSFACHVTRLEGTVEVVGLLVTVNAEANRVAMHAVRRSLLELQADRLGLPVHVVEIPSPCPNQVYEAKMAVALETATAAGVEHVVFGDLFLADVRAYRESALAGSGIGPLFPLWGRPTEGLAREMLEAGVRAVITCIDPSQLSSEFVGRTFDEQLLSELPDSVDPCGERGEFHTFAFAGPMFSKAIEFELGEIVERDGFCYADLCTVSASRVSASI